MAKITVLKNIPMPENSNRTYPFDDLDEVGMMFFVEADAGEDLRALAKRVGSAASSRKKRDGRDYSTMEITYEGKPGVGVWRTG